MTHFGYTAMGEQVPAKQLVTDLVAAELAGFDFSVMSDHFSPWIEEQGHSPNAWVVLGAAAQATQALPLMTFVTCPTFRYHPVVVAQQAATLGVLSSGRFTLGLGAGENLNEHVIGGGWPMGRVRQERLAEAVEIIRSLFTGDYVNFSGQHFQVERARLYDLPDSPPPVGIAASGPSSVKLAGARPRAVAVGRPGWHVMAELPDPRAFDAASGTVREEDVTALVPCGPDVGSYVKAAREWIDAGFTHLALVQVGAGSQQDFIAWAAAELLPALREL